MNAQDRRAFDGLQKEVSQLSEAVKDLKEVLVGSELHPQGLLNNVSFLRSRVKKIEWLFIAAFLLAGGQWAELLSKFLL